MKMGRPKIPSNQRKRHQVGVRFTPSEALKIHCAAELAGQKPGTWLRETVMRHVRSEPVSPELGYSVIVTKYNYRKLKDGRFQHPVTKEVVTQDQLQKQCHSLTFERL